MPKISKVTVMGYSPFSRTAVLLVADDSAADRNMVRRALKKGRINCHIQEVENGEQAIAYLRGEGEYHDRKTHPFPHLLLLDINMPIVDGKDVLKVIRDDESINPLPVAMLTTSKNEQDKFETYELGATAYIIKPIKAGTFVRTIQKLECFQLELIAV